MKQIYSIQGMTCSGCSSHVATILSKVEGVVKVAVDLEAAKATIEMGEPLSVEVFQAALQVDGGRYQIEEH